MTPFHRLFFASGRDGRETPEQAVSLAVDPSRAVEGVAVAAAAAEADVSERLVADRVPAAFGERAEERPGRRVKGVDLAEVVGEVAHQQVAAELSEAGRSHGD